MSQKSKLEERRKSTEPQNWESSVWEAEMAIHRQEGVVLGVPQGPDQWSYRRLSLGRGWQAPGGWVWSMGEH